MKTFKKRFFSMFLAVAMLFSMANSIVLADGTENEEVILETSVSGIVKPVNYAAVHITRDGYADHEKYSRALAVYYNTLYSNYIYSEFGSVISSYKIPMKDALSGVSISYYLDCGGMQEDRIVPVFYDFNKFDLEATPGVYAGPVEATDTTEATEATAEYSKALSYTANYWPSGYSYSGTPFASQVAHEILESGSGLKTYDVTGKVLDGLKKSESDFITFATGRETSGYANASLRLSSESYIPTLTLTYDSIKIVETINSTPQDGIASLLETLNDAGILSNSNSGYYAYSGLKAIYKSQIEAAIYEKISDSGFSSVSEFLSDYDKIIAETVNSIVKTPEIYINFDNGTADNVMGDTNDGTLSGSPEFITGFNGSKALKIENEFGKSAEEYLSLGAYDTESSSFSIVFWMRAPERGVKYEETGDSIAKATTTIDFSTYTGTKGGVVFSNKDFSTPENAGFAFAAMPIYSDFSVNMKIGENASVNTDGYAMPVDSRWHQVAYVVNREGNATVYVDNKAIYTKNISALTGSFGAGSLNFGADALGQYGMMKGEFDEIKVYGAALDSSKIEELYHLNALGQLSAEMENLKTGENKTLYTDSDFSELTEKISEIKAYASGYQLGNAEALAQYYNTQNDYFNNFLNRNVNGIAAYGSDVHISENNENHLSAKNLKNFFQDGSGWEKEPGSFIISGDLADVGADDLDYFMSYVNNWMPSGKNLVVCRGNHDEPAGKNNATGETLSRTTLANNFITFLKGYVDTTLTPNQSLVDENGEHGTLNYYSTDGAAHYISIDAYWPNVREISDAQLTWLDETLKTVSGDGKPIFYVQHVPLLNTTSGSSYLGLNANDDAQVKSILNKYQNVFVLNGHSHHGFGSGSGTPVKIGNIWQVNTSILASKEISRGYEYGTGYYINVYDDRVIFRARDFENKKWLREYDMTFMLNQELESYEPIDKINDVTSEAEMKELIAEFGIAGTLELGEQGYTVYTTFTDEWQDYIVSNLYTTLSTTGFETLDAFLAEYDKLVAYVIDETTEDPVVLTVSPENYAVVHITQTGYSSHTKNAKTLGAYYNSLNSPRVYAEFGSVISTYEIPFKEMISKLSVTYYFIKGGMDPVTYPKRTVPILYDFNKFDMGLDAGYYAGPKAATDTTEAVDATEGYQKIIEYTTNYWRADNGYGVSGTPFASKVAHSILETTTDYKTFDVTDKVLPGFKNENSNYITFATGRETNKNTNTSFEVTTEAKIPVVTLEYAAADLVEYLNSKNTTEEMREAIENLILIQAFKSTASGNEGYSTLIDGLKNYVASEMLYQQSVIGGYADMESVYAAYDEIVTYAQENGLLLSTNGVESTVELDSLLTQLGESGALQNAECGYEGYKELLSNLKPNVINGLYEVISQEGFENMEAFYSLYNELVTVSGSSGLLEVINSAASADSLENIVTEMGTLGLFDKNASNPYESFTALSDNMKDYVITELYNVISGDGYSELSEFYQKYDELVDYAPIKEILDTLNATSSPEEMASTIVSLGDSGKLEESVEGYAGYTALNSDMKKYVEEELFKIVSDGGFEDLTTFYKSYDKAITDMSEIPAKISPENYATIHITQSGYGQHVDNAKALGVYYNRLYSGYTYAEFGSVVSSYEVPLKKSLSDISVTYQVVAGGMQSGRTIPVFYDFNKFDLNVDAGYYAGPKAATDTEAAVEATETYNNAIAYTNNYWPASGYSYSGTNFATKKAVSILETSSGSKTYDVTATVLTPFMASESDYITFATGRDTSEYANGAFYINSDARIPKLILTYDALSILDTINNTKETEMANLISDLGNAGILANTTSGYDAYTALSPVCQEIVLKTLFDTASTVGYTTFKAFAEDYDLAVTNVEEPAKTGMGVMVISDSEKEYAVATEAAGKSVAISVPVTFEETEGTFTAILAEYAGNVLKAAKTKDVLATDTEIEFTHTLSSDVTEVKVILIDSLTGMKPMCEAVSDIGGILDGKKVIFIGNSHVYRGLAVTQVQNSVYDQASRSNDKGYFYQLCKANGSEVSVTNWTFGSHGTSHLFNSECSLCNGVKHEEYLTDRYFDYVIINSGTRTDGTATEKILNNTEYAMNLFKEVNPDVKFILWGNASSRGVNEYNTPYSDVTATYPTLAEKGVTIADWGYVIKGILSNEYTVPGAKYAYSKSSFIVKDNYHTNPLAGYLATLTAYCAITGEAAVGMPYSFYNDTALNEKFDMDAYMDEYYTNGSADTNFDEIFESPSDMNGLQQLIDKWFAEKHYNS